MKKELFSKSKGQIQVPTGNEGFGKQERRLQLACEEGALKTVKRHIEVKKANAHAKNRDGQTALFTAAKAHNNLVVDYLKVGVNASNESGISPLMSVILNKPVKGEAKAEEKSEKEKAQAEKEKKEKEEKEQKEFEDALKKQEETVKTLLRNDVKVEAAKFNDGKRALHLAAENGSLNMVKILLREGNANPNAKDNYNRTPLHYAAYGDLNDVVEELLEAKADINAVDTNGASPIWYVGGAKTASTLIKKGADVKNLRAYSKLPLQAASVAGQLDVVKTLVEEGHDPLNDKDRESLNLALDLARNKDHADIVEYLRGRLEFEGLLRQNAALLKRVEALEKRAATEINLLH